MPRPLFLAAPERGHGSLSVIEALLRELQILTNGALKGNHVFVPHLQVGDVGVETDAATYFTRSLEAINEARVVVAVLDGPQVDEQVAFWAGCAFAAGKPVIGYRTDARETSPMVEGALRSLARDGKELEAALRGVLFS